MEVVLKLLFLFFLHFRLFAHEVDVIVFSCDRPLQLYAFLESLYLHGTHIHDTSVLYRCSSSAYHAGYENVINAFPQARFIYQTNPPHDFKPLFMKAVFEAGSAEYVVIGVDDIIITDKIDFNECIEALQAANGYAFYLRLGQNIDDCWSSGQYEGIPPLTKVSNKIYSWIFNTGIGNWAYPNSNDMTIYRKKDIEPHLRTAHFYNTATLEDRFGVVNLELKGLCYETSRIVNIPLNIVSETSTRHLDISAQELLDLFNDGLKMDIDPLFQYRNRSAHVYTFNPSFVPRNLSK